MNPYRVLHVRRNASAVVITKAYRAAVLQHHPDRGGSREQFDRVEAAYRVLSDPAARAHYDRTGECRPPRPGRERGRLVTLLSGAYQAAVGDTLTAGGDVAAVDLVANMRRKLEAERAPVREQLKAAAEVEAALAEAAGRFKTLLVGRATDADDLLGEIARSKLGEIREQLERLRGAEAGLTEAIDYLTGVRYEHAPRPAPPGPPAMNWTRTAVYEVG